MVLIFFIWVLVFVNSFAFGLLLVPSKYLPVSLVSILGLSLQGIICSLLYQWIPINSFLLIVFSIFSILILYFLKPNVLLKISKLKRQEYILIILVLLICLHICSKPFFFFDEQLYYLQTIEWIQNYPAIKGLANLHFRLGFMSAWHTLSALYNLPTDYLSNDLNGYLYFIFFIFILESRYFFRKEAYYILTVFFFLFNISSSLGFISSTTPDTSSALFIAVILTLFYEYKQGNSTISLSIIYILVAFAIGLKISNLHLLFLIVITFSIERKYLTPLLFFTLTICVFLARNLIISGYILYPFTGLGGFNLEWEVSREMNVGYLFWYYRFASWESWSNMLSIRFLKYSWLSTLFNYTLIICSMTLFLIVALIKRFKKNEISSLLKHHKHLILLMSLAMLFHFFTLPSITSGYIIRFIFGVIFWFNAFTIVFVFNTLKLSHHVYSFLLYFTTFVLLVRTLSVHGISKPVFFTPSHYQTSKKLKKEKLDKYYFYNGSKNFCSDNFPCFTNSEFELLGDDISEGFKAATSEKTEENN